jgi:hypothetical protein
MLDFYLGNISMLLTSIAAAAISVKEARGRTITRSRLLALGVLAFASIFIQLAFTDPEELLDASRWLLMFVALLAGGVRGHLMRLSSDRALGLVRVHRSPEVRWVAYAQAFFAAVQFAIEVGTGADSRIEPTIEFLMMATAGYLLGRGGWAWWRAGQLVHEDLRD